MSTEKTRKRGKYPERTTLHRLLFLLGLAAVGGCQNYPPPASMPDTISPPLPEDASPPAAPTAVRDPRPEVWQDMISIVDPFGARSRDAIENSLRTESEAIARQQARTIQNLSKPAPAANPLLAFEPQFNPMDEVNMSLEMDNTDVRHLLYAVAQAARFNLLIHPDLLAEPRQISVSFQDMPVSRVLEEILRTADLYGQLKNNTLRVDALQEVIFNLDFIETNTESSFNLGGDVLGVNLNTGGVGSGGGGAGGGQNRGQSSGTTGGGQQQPIKGSVQLTGRGAKGTNSYDYVESMVKTLMGNAGVFHLNRQTGTLLLRAKPSVVRTVSELLGKYKAALSRQILIETRIMEVRLNDAFQSGIDWNLLNNQISLAKGMSQTMGALTGALPFGLAPTDRSLTIGSVTANNTPATSNNLSVMGAGRKGSYAINLLKSFGDIKVVSNPTIRAKHGQPAIISVGQTNAYVRNTTVTVTPGAIGGSTTQSQVETDSVFNGLILEVTPFINANGKISMTVTPIKSEVDLSNTQTANDIQITLPQVDLKGLSTVLDMQNDETTFLGGLIDRDKRLSRDGVPILSEIPVLGGLFSNIADRGSTRELVIMLHVVVL